MDSCKRRLLDYCAGKIAKIEELQEKLLPFIETDEYDKIATASTLWGQQ